MGIDQNSSNAKRKGTGVSRRVSNESRCGLDKDSGVINVGVDEGLTCN